MHEYVIKYLEMFKNLEYAEVVAVIDKESGGNVKCLAFEERVNDYSYGPMQVRLKTARGMGFRGDPQQLLTWEYGIYYGMKYLSICKEKVTKEYLKLHDVADKHVIRKRMFASYNAGGVYWKAGHEGVKYINHGYVRQCEWNYWRHYRYNFVYKGA